MFIAIALLISYLIALVVIGDGAIPMGLILIFGLISPLAAPTRIAIVIAGWIGIIGLISTTFIFRSNPLKQITYQFLASIILYLSWLAFAIIGNYESGSLFSSFVLSVPLQITFFIVVFRFGFLRELANTESNNKL